MEEKSFLNERGVTVTNARYIFTVRKQPQTVALSGITSVTTQKIDVKWFLIVPLIFFGMMILSSSVMTALVFWVIAGMIFMFLKAKHIVVTTSASGASKGYTSKDGVFVTRVVDALNNAIISRG
ncbi:MAG: DUF6232 family protein [Gallionella sp.]|nr:DUF6232 family protein [Gallionella sp.]